MTLNEIIQPLVNGAYGVETEVLAQVIEQLINKIPANYESPLRSHIRAQDALKDWTQSLRRWEKRLAGVPHNQHQEQAIQICNVAINKAKTVILVLYDVLELPKEQRTVTYN